jgi:Mobilization protein NikA
MENGAKKHRKARAQRKEESIRVRVTAQQKRALAERAQRAGLDVSAWLRSLGLRELERDSTAA